MWCESMLRVNAEQAHDEVLGILRKLGPLRATSVIICILNLFDKSWDTKGKLSDASGRIEVVLDYKTLILTSLEGRVVHP
jgi:hypothetical protein